MTERYERYISTDSQLEVLLTFKRIDDNKARDASYILNYYSIIYASYANL